MRRILILVSGVLLLICCVVFGGAQRASAQASLYVGTSPITLVVPGSSTSLYVGLGDTSLQDGETNVLTVTEETLPASTVVFTTSLPTEGISRTVGRNSNTFLYMSVFVPADTPEGVSSYKRLTVRDTAGNTATTDIEIRVSRSWTVSINNGALFTRSTSVSVTVRVASFDPDFMQLSNDGGFVNALWRPYTTTLTWEIEPYGSFVLPRTVYVRFFSPGYPQSITNAFSDDIVLDKTAPTGSVVLGEGVVQLNAQDDISGVEAMRLGRVLGAGEWQPYKQIAEWPPNTSVVVTFRDRAGNLSSQYRAGPGLALLPLLYR